MASILVVGPHPDDQELGMGGTIALLAHQGHQVTLLDMTDGEPTPAGDRATRLVEAKAAAEALSPPLPGRPITRILLDMPNRRVEPSLTARHAVAGAMRAVQAQIVFVPYFKDAHPDHIATTSITQDARFDAKLTKLTLPGDRGQPPIYPQWLIYYYATHLRIIPTPSFIIDTSMFAGHKLRAINAYASQFVKNPSNRAVPERITTQDRYLGSRINAQAGECFFTDEPLGLNGLSSLVGLG
jgi:bacillithiol biosynthesis deacetylase BshB1